MRVHLKNIHPATFASFAGVFVLALTPFMLLGATMLLGASIALGVSGFIAWNLHRTIGQLDKRIHATGGNDWVLNVNGIAVGNISDADYAGIQKHQLTSLRLYIAQALNSARCLNKVACDCLYLIPVVLFWVGVGMIIFAPKESSEVLAEMLKAEPTQLIALAKSMIVMLITLCVSVFVVAAMSFASFGLRNIGFVDYFGQDLANKLCDTCNVPTTGDICLTRWKNQTFNAISIAGRRD